MSKSKYKINTVFLILGILFSIISKALQFIFNSKLGDMIVIPSAIFFVLAILFSVPKFIELTKNKATKKIAYIIAILSCTVIVSFQLMMILLIGNKNYLGLVFIVPIILCSIIIIKYYLRVFV